MAHLGIETAHNVVLDHEVASLGDRIVAYIIDQLILGAWALFWIFVMIFSGAPGGGEFWVVVMMLLVLLPYLLYHLVCEVALDGQSLGKRSRKIRVARTDGGQPRLGQYLLRWVLRPIDSFYFLGLIVILVNGRGQRLGDLAAGTTVISLKPRLKLQDTIMAEVKPGHVVRFPEAQRLTDSQAAIIRDVLRSYRLENRWSLLAETAGKVSTVLGVDMRGMKDLEFLETVLADHVHLSGGQGSA